MQHTDRHINPDAPLSAGLRHAKRRCFCASCTQEMINAMLFYTHPLLQTSFYWDTERYRCARYLARVQAVRQADLSRTDMLDAIECCRRHPGDVGKELAE